MAVELYLTRTMERFLRLLEKDVKKVENGRLKRSERGSGQLASFTGGKRVMCPCYRVKYHHSQKFFDRRIIENFERVLQTY